MALQANAADLRKEFPLATFRILDKQGKPLARHSTVVPAALVACCPASMRQVVYDRMQQAIQAVQAGTATIDTSGLDASMAQQMADVRRVEHIREQLQKDFRCGILMAVNTAAQTCSITCLKVLLPAVEAQVRAVLGLPAQQPQAPAATAAAAAPLPHEQRALKALQVSCLPFCQVKAALSTYTAILLAGMLSLAQFASLACALCIVL